MKKQGKFIFVIVVLAVLLIASGVYIMYEKGIIFSNVKGNKNQDGTVQKNINDNEIEITDSKIIDVLNSNVSMISRLNLTMPIVDNLYQEEKVTYISKKNKLGLVLRSLDEKFVPVTKGVDELSSIVGQNVAYGITNEISQQMVEEKYYSLFGEKLENFSIDSDFCPLYYYDEQNKVYYGWHNCGGAADQHVITYNYKYAYNNDQYYVYQSVGYVETDFETNETKIYNDIKKTNELKVTEMNKQTYEQFSQYRFTFTKINNENYIFTSVERVNMGDE